MIIKVSQGQTIFDLAALYYGCYEGVYIIIEDNPTIGLDTELEPLTQIVIRDEVPALTGNNQIDAVYFKQNEMSFNSSLYPAVVSGDFELEDYDNGYLN